MLFVVALIVKNAFALFEFALENLSTGDLFLRNRGHLFRLLFRLGD